MLNFSKNHFFSILFLGLFLISCGGKKQEATKLNILTTKITTNQIPKDLIEIILPFNEGKNIIFAPIIKNISTGYTFNITESANTGGLTLKMDQLQKKIKPLYEALKLPDSLKITNTNKFTKEQYFEKMGINKDSALVIVYGTGNLKFEFLKEYPKIILENVSNIEDFRKKVSNALQKNPKLNVYLLYNVEFHIRDGSEGNTMADSKKLIAEIEARNDSIKNIKKEKEEALASKSDLEKLRDKTSSPQDKQRIDEQIIKLNDLVAYKDQQITQLQIKVAELQKEVDRLEKENKELKTINNELRGNVETYKQKEASAVAETEEERKKREKAEKEAEEAKKQAIINQRNGFIENGKQRTINIRLEKGKLVFYEQNTKGEWKPETINRLKNIRPLRKKYRQDICDTYKKAFELAKSNNLLGELNYLNAIFEEKRQISYKLAIKAEEAFEENISNGTSETWFNKVCL